MVIAACAVVSLAAAATFARLYLTGDRLVALVSSRASAALRGTVRVHGATFRLPVHLALDGVELVDPAGIVRARIEHVEVELALLPLLRRRVELALVDARGVLVDLAPATPGGRPALLEATAPRSGAATEDAEPSSWSFAVAEGRLAGARVVGLPAGAPPSVGPGDLHVRDARWDARHGLAAITELTVAIGTARLEASGEAVHLGTSPEVDGQARLHLPLDELAPWVPALASAGATGPVDLEARVRAGGGSTRVTARLTGADLRLRDVAVRAVDCAGNLEREVVTVSTCTLSPAAGGALHLAGRLDPAGLDHELSLVIEHLPLRAVAGPLVPDPSMLPESVDGRLELGPPAGTNDLARARVDLELSGLPRAGAALLPRDLHVAGTASITREALDPLALVASAGTLHVRLDGRVPIEAAGELAMRVRLEDRDPVWLGELAPGLVTGPLSVDTRVAGNRADPRVTGVARVTALRLGAVPPMAARLPFSADLRRVEMVDAELTGAAGRLTASAVLTTGRGAPRLAASGRGSIILEALGARGVGGRLDVRASAAGLLAAPSARVTLSTQGLILPGAPAARLEASAEVRRDVVRAQGHLDGGGGSTHFEATYALPRRRLDALVEARAVPLEPLSSLTGFAVAGHLDGRMVVNGPIEQAAVQGELKAVRASVRGVELGDALLSASGSMSAVAAHLSLRGPAGDLTADATVRPDSRELRADGHARGLSLGRLLAAAGMTGHDATIDLDLHAAGPMRRPTSLDVAARATHVVIAGSPLADALELQAHAAGRDTYQVEATLGRSAAGSVLVDLGAQPSARGRLTVTELQVDRLVPALGDLGVAVKTTAEVEGLWTAASGAAAHGHVAALELTAAGSQVRAASPASFAYDGEALRLEPVHLVGAHGVDFEVRGVVARDLDVHVGGRLDVGLVAPFVPAIAHASGDVEVTAQAAGPVTSPSVTGELRVAGPVVVRPRSGVREVRLDEGWLRATGDVRGTRVDADVEGSLDGGPFSLKGTATLAELRPQRYDLTFSAQNLPVRTSNLLVEANADLRLTGNADRAALGGTVDVVRGRYLEKFELRDFNFVAREPPVETSLGVEAPWLAKVDLDVQATSESGLNLRVDAGVISVDLQLSSDLHVGGTASDPVVEGRVEATRGTLQFPKAKLEVSQAVVELAPDRGGQPELDLRADGEVTPPATGTASSSTYFVQLRLSGGLRSMALELSSSPELNRLEVLALLVRGEANLSLLSSNNPAGGSAGSSSTLDAALAFAGSQLTAPLSKFISDQLEKSLNLNLQLGAEVTSSGFRITASQQLTPRLSVQGAYERTLGVPGASTSARARLLLTDRLFLEGSTMATTNPASDVAGDTSESRLELKWRLLGL